MSSAESLKSATTDDFFDAHFSESFGTSPTGTVYPTQHFEFVHELGADLHSNDIHEERFLPGPSRVVVKSRVVGESAHQTQSPEYLAAIRRRKAREIAEKTTALQDAVERADFAMSTHPVISAVREAITALQDGEREGNSREIFRQIRDSMKNGGWDEYRKPQTRTVVCEALNFLARQEEVVPSDVERVRTSFVENGLSPVRMTFDDVEEEDKVLD